MFVGRPNIRYPGLTVSAVRDWLDRVQVQTLFVEPGSPWKNGYVESFNGNLRDELLSRETFYALMEAKVLVEGWRREHNWIRPHSALGYRPPAHEAIESRSGEGKISVDRHARLG